MKEYTVSEVRAKWKRIIDEVSASRRVLVTRHGKPMAMIVPAGKRSSRKTLRPLRNLPITIAADFDEPTDGLWEETG